MCSCQQPQAELLQTAEAAKVAKVPLGSPQLADVGSGQEEQPLNLVQTAMLSTSLLGLSAGAMYQDGVPLAHGRARAGCTPDMLAESCEA